MPYLLLNLLFLVGLAVLLSARSERAQDPIILLATFGSILFFNTFKDYTLLPDAPGYAEAWRYICRENSVYNRATDYYKMQWGYFALNKVLSLFFHSTRFFFFAMGCIISLPYCYLIKKYSANVTVSCLLYFMGVIQSTFVLRQHAAIGFCLLAIPLLCERRMITVTLLLWAAAIAIHPTAVIFGLVILAAYLRNIRLWYIIMLAFAVLLYFIYPYLVLLFADNTAGYQVYAEALDEYSNNSTAILHGSLWLIATIVLMPLSTADSTTQFFYRILCIVAIFALLSAIRMGGELLPRMIMYLTAVEIFFIPNIGKHIQQTYLRSAFYALYLMLFFYMFAFSAHSRILDCKIEF